MDKEMKRLQKQIANLKALIEKEEDETKLGNYQSDLEEALEAKGALQARMDAELVAQKKKDAEDEDELVEKRNKSQFSKILPYYGMQMDQVVSVHQLVSNAIQLGGEH